VSTLLPLLDGLREAHDKGIVHRDIKPENLFISKTARGRLQPKVLDFGIAKLEESSESCRLTQDGTVLGSPGYFSPEQARGETNIDLRTDIWSISVVLYELITGELPFNGANYNALLMSILKDTPKSFMDHGRGDTELWRIVQRGLMRDRNKRWDSMWELGRALAGWLYEQGVTADVTSRSIKEVWLEARSASEQAPSPDPQGSDAPRRRVLSTIKRRVADTLAGETMSTLIAQHRVPTRILGWSAAAAGVGAILWSLLVQSGTSGTVAHAATAAPVAATELAPPVSAAPVVAAAPVTAAAEPSTPRTAEAPASSTRTGRVTVDKKAAGAAKAVVTAKPRPVEATAKPTRATVSAAKAKSTGAPARKGIDKEFGF
jgi:hypothetical protein